MNNRRRKNRTT